MAYNPLSYFQEYNPRGNTANGITGSLTDASIQNAALNTTSAVGKNVNPFAEFVATGKKQKPAVAATPKAKAAPAATVSGLTNVNAKAAPLIPMPQSVATAPSIAGLNTKAAPAPLIPTTPQPFFPGGNPDAAGTSTTYFDPATGGTTTARPATPTMNPQPAPGQMVTYVDPITGATTTQRPGGGAPAAPLIPNPVRPAPGAGGGGMFLREPEMPDGSPMPGGPGGPIAPPPPAGGPTRGAGPSTQPPFSPVAGVPANDPWEAAPAPPGTTTVIPSTIGRPGSAPLIPIGGVEPPVVTTAPSDPGRYYGLTPFEMFNPDGTARAPLSGSGAPGGINPGGGAPAGRTRPFQPIGIEPPVVSTAPSPLANPKPDNLPPTALRGVRQGTGGYALMDQPTKSLIPIGPVEPSSILYGGPKGSTTTTANPDGSLTGLSGLTRAGTPTVGGDGSSLVSANSPTGLTSVNAGKSGGPAVGSGGVKGGGATAGAGGKAGAPMAATGGLAGKGGTPGLGQGAPSTPTGGTRPRTPTTTTPTTPTAPATPSAPATPTGGATPGQPPAEGLQSPDDLSWFDKIQQDALDAARRQGTHLASLTGAVDSGGFVPGMQEEFNRLVNQFGAQKGAMMFEAQQNAAARILDKYKFDNAQDLQKWIKENEFALTQAGIDAGILTARYSADAQRDAAQSAASAAGEAAMYSADAARYNALLDYQLGQQRLGFDRYATDQGNAINWGQLGLGFQNSNNQYNLGLYGTDVAREANIMDYMNRFWANGPEWARFIAGGDPSSLIPGVGFGGIQVVN